MKGKAVAASDSYHAAQAYDQDPVTDWQDYSNFYDEYDDDEEVTWFFGQLCSHAFAYNNRFSFASFKPNLAHYALISCSSTQKPAEYCSISCMLHHACMCHSTGCVQYAYMYAI